MSFILLCRKCSANRASQAGSSHVLRWAHHPLRQTTGNGAHVSKRDAESSRRLTGRRARGTVARSFIPVRTFRAAFLRIGLVVALAAGCARTPPPAVSGAPYVVLVTIDTLRADATSPYGAPVEDTPSLSAFARQSVQFERAATTMPTTGPAHIAILSGLYPQQFGALQNGVAARPGTRSLADVMR